MEESGKLNVATASLDLQTLQSSVRKLIIRVCCPLIGHYQVEYGIVTNQLYTVFNFPLGRSE